jgi:hypothetical protein
MSRTKVKAKRAAPRQSKPGRDRNRDAVRKAQMRRILQEQEHRRRMTRKDSTTGEEYILARLAMVDKADVEAYRAGLVEAVQGHHDAPGQAEAIRRYLQAWVDSKRLVAVTCGQNDKPTCRVFGGDNPRVVVIRQDEAAAEAEVEP